MSASLEASLWAAQSGQALDTVQSVLRADQPYTPQAPAEDSSVLDFFTSAQAVLGVIAALIALILLVFQLWSSRREGRSDSGQPGKRGGRTDGRVDP